MTASVDETLERLSRVVDDRLGIVTAVQLPRLDAGDPPVRIAESHPARLIGHKGTAGVNQGGGAALERNIAIIKAIAESIERYCAAFSQGKRRFVTWHELDGVATPPEDFALFSDAQYRTPGFPFKRFDRNTPTQWVHGRALSNGQSRWVPAAFVHLPHHRAQGEPRITTSISTGLAAGDDEHSATASALLEVVERDAFMLAWRHRVPTPGIDLDSIGLGHEATLVAALRSTGMRCRARLITQDIALPVVVVVLQGRTSTQPAAVIGAGAAAQPLRAVRLALEEACLSLFGINRLMRDLENEIAHASDDELNSLTLQSTAFAIRPEFAEAAAHLFGDDLDAEIVTIADLDRRFANVADGSLDTLVPALGRWSQHAVMVDCTTPDVRDIGFRVVRVVIPELRPLDHDAGVPHLGGHRWLDRPRYDDPHPFP